jgi:hypothetical protein
VPATDRSTRTSGRCPLHPASPAPYACDRCGRALCLTCATPVRGAVLGPECLSAVLGPEVVEEPARGRARPGRPLRFHLAGLGLAVALAGTVTPWSSPNFSHYTGLFGGWGFSPLAWSLLAAVGAAAGTVGWTVAWLTGRGGRGWLLALAGAGLAAVAGAALFATWPPFATHPWLGPAITLGGGAVATFGALWAAARTTRGTGGALPGPVPAGGR